jgi:tetratricopeptide (TPR) repeat protein
MLLRLWLSAMCLLFCLGLCGCYPGSESTADEQKNPYFLAGKERLAGRDYKGAIEAFEKALEANPHSAQAHFELGVLYEQHSDQKEEDYVAAMFHYQEAIKLRPNDYPADNARQRVAYCKRELVKAESLAPVAQNLMREREKLQEENRLLRKQLEASLQTASRGTQTRPSTTMDSGTAPAPIQVRANSTASLSRGSDLSTTERVTPLPPAAVAGRSHAVKPGETLYSISRLYHVSLAALLSANPALEPKRMKVGLVLNIPSA